uniref:hypothetical protein n=1 Tax=Sphingobacterium multivorum TaxID=28454 RepID=UPI002899D83D
MKKIELVPLVGIQIEGIGQVNLGAGRAEVHGVLGAPSDALDDQYYYDELELRLDFNDQGTLEFIESINGPYPEKTEINIYGVNPFHVEAAELVRLLTDKN